MTAFKRIAVAGVGQIGGSAVAAELINNREASIVAYDIDGQVKAKFFQSPKIIKAIEEGELTVDEINDKVKFTTNPADAKGSELVEIAVWGREAGNVIRAFNPYIDENTTITTVCSVLEKVITRVEEAYAEGHPRRKKPTLVPYHILNGSAGTSATTSSSR